MKKIFKGLLATSLVALGVLGVASCGKDKLIVATNAEFPPFEFDGDQGFDMDLIREFGEYVGKEIEIKDVEFDAALLAVQNGQADIAIAGLTVNESRKQVLSFSNPYYSSNQVVSTKTGSDLASTISSLTSIEDICHALEGKKIGCQRGTTGQYFIQGDADWEFEGIKDADVRDYDNGGLAMKDLNDGKIDAVILDEAPTNSIVSSKYENLISVSNVTLTQEEYAIAVKLGNQELVDQLNEFINHVKQNGKFDALIKKYFGEE